MHRAGRMARCAARGRGAQDMRRPSRCRLCLRVRARHRVIRGAARWWRRLAERGDPDARAAWEPSRSQRLKPPRALVPPRRRARRRPGVGQLRDLAGRGITERRRSGDQLRLLRRGRRWTRWRWKPSACVMRRRWHRRDAQGARLSAPGRSRGAGHGRSGTATAALARLKRPWRARRRAERRSGQRASQARDAEGCPRRRADVGSSAAAPPPVMAGQRLDQMHMLGAPR